MANFPDLTLSLHAYERAHSPNQEKTLASPSCSQVQTDEEIDETIYFLANGIREVKEGKKKPFICSHIKRKRKTIFWLIIQ